MLGSHISRDSIGEHQMRETETHDAHDILGLMVGNVMFKVSDVDYDTLLKASMESLFQSVIQWSMCISLGQSPDP